MDSVELSVDHTQREDGHEWRLAVETFSTVDASIVGQQFWLGDGDSISDYVLGQVLRAVQHQAWRLIVSDMGVHCMDHEIVWCEVCGLKAYEPGPFD